MLADAPPRAPDTHRLSYRDEEIVIRWRQGESTREIAEALGYSWQKVQWALNRAQSLGVSLRRLP